MTVKIDFDHARFRQIVRGKIRSELKRYVQNGELIGRQGKEVVRIPVPKIDIPRFKYGDQQQGGVGAGPGDVGDPVSGEEGDEPGQGHEAGSKPGEHSLEAELTLEELAAILGEELELPKIEPRQAEKIVTEKIKYTGINRVGPNSLRHFKRSYREALKRQISMGQYDPKNPRVIPIPDDMRYRSWKVQRQPQTAAVIIYMMDVSGSMGDEQKEIVRLESFWLDAWLRSQYKGLATRFVIHDAVAREVDRDTFFRTRESGGTMISSAYRLAMDIIERDYPPEQWNIYPFHFSDGDNWSNDDTQTCLRLLESEMLPIVNQFGYGQVESPYGSGQFIRDLRERFGESHERLVLSRIPDRESILSSIKDFLGRGR